MTTAQVFGGVLLAVILVPILLFMLLDDPGAFIVAVGGTALIVLGVMLVSGWTP